MRSLRNSFSLSRAKNYGRLTIGPLNIVYSQYTPKAKDSWSCLKQKAISTSLWQTTLLLKWDSRYQDTRLKRSTILCRLAVGQRCLTNSWELDLLKPKKSTKRTRPLIPKSSINHMKHKRLLKPIWKSTSGREGLGTLSILASVIKPLTPLYKAVPLKLLNDQC